MDTDKENISVTDSAQPGRLDLLWCLIQGLVDSISFDIFFIIFETKRMGIFDNSIKDVDIGVKYTENLYGVK